MAFLSSADREDHFAIGLTATVQDGATPVGWDESMGEFDLVSASTAQITAVASSEEGCPFGSFEVHGWYWDPADLEIA